MLVFRHYTLSRCCVLASLKLSDICNVNSEEILQTHQEYRAKLSPISSMLSSSFLPVCKALCSFPCCVADRNIWLFAIKAAMGVSVGLVLNVSTAQVQLRERRPILSLTHWFKIRTTLLEVQRLEWPWNRPKDLSLIKKLNQNECSLIVLLHNGPRT